MSTLSTVGRRLLLAAPLSLFLAAAALPGATPRRRPAMTTMSPRSSHRNRCSTL